MPQLESGAPAKPKPRKKAPPIKVYVKPKARSNVQAGKAVNFINKEVGKKVVKLTADKSKAKVVVKRGPNEGGGGYTYGQPRTAKDVTDNRPTRIRVDTSKGAQSGAGWEGSKKTRTRTTDAKKTGKLGGHISKKNPNFSPTVAQTTAHEITHALGLSHRIGYHKVDGKWKKTRSPGPHIMDWSSSHYSESEKKTILEKTTPPRKKRKPSKAVKARRGR